MSLAQIALPDLAHEIGGARRMLERYPTGKDDFSPHAKSGSIGKLAAHMAHIPGLGVMVLTTSEFDMAQSQFPPAAPASMDPAGLTAYLEANWSALQKALDGASDEALKETWTFRVGEHVVMSMPRFAVLRTLVVNHLIHHRAQLTMYYRALDVPIPGLYGPSADER